MTQAIFMEDFVTLQQLQTGDCALHLLLNWKMLNRLYIDTSKSESVIYIFHQVCFIEWSNQNKCFGDDCYAFLGTLVNGIKRV